MTTCARFSSASPMLVSFREVSWLFCVVRSMAAYLYSRGWTRRGRHSRRAWCRLAGKPCILKINKCLDGHMGACYCVSFISLLSALSSLYIILPFNPYLLSSFPHPICFSSFNPFFSYPLFLRHCSVLSSFSLVSLKEWRRIVWRDERTREKGGQGLNLLES